MNKHLILSGQQNSWMLALLLLSMFLLVSTQVRAASADTALSFDGVDDYVSASIGSAMASNYTISAWVYVRTAASNFDPGTAIVSGSCGTTAELLLRNQAGVNVVELGRCNFFVGDASVATLPNLQWVHVAVVVSATKQVSYFINGLTAGTWNASAREVALGPDIALGFNNGSNRRFDGMLDEVQVWNIARSQSEIHQTMNAPLSGSEPGMIAYWRFNEGSGTSALDSSGHGATGAVLNGPAWVASTVPLSAPTITAQPMNQAVFVGSNATFAVSATSTNPPVRYQWHANGMNLASATNATVTITNVQAFNIGDYDVLVSDSVGSVISSLVQLTLLDPPLPIVTTLAERNVGGTRAVLNGTVNPNGAFTAGYFQYGVTTNYGASTPGISLGSGGMLIPTGSVISNLVRNTTYHFRLAAYNVTGTNYGEDRAFTTRNTAGPVAVLGAPIYQTWNEDVRTKLLATGFFDQVDTFMIAPGFPVPSLAALSNYAAVLVYVGGSSYNNGVALGNLLGDYLEQAGGVVIAAQGFENMGGKFLTSGYMPFTPGFFSSGSFLSLVKVLPNHPLLEGVNSFNGGAASYQNDRIVTSNATLVANWSSGTPLIAAKELGVGRVAGLNFMPVSGAMSANFWQTNTDGARLLANALLWVQLTRPTITQQPTNQFVVAGANATFSVSVTTTNPPLRYQWRFNGTNIANATNDSLTITNVQPVNVGNYNVLVSDNLSSVSSAPASLNLLAPYISMQPVNAAVKVSSNATFAVIAAGVPQLVHQWRFNGVSIANETNSTLLITNVQAPQLGGYTAVITNNYGAVTSTVATLTFLTPPTIVQQPLPVTVVVGENATFTVTVTNSATLPVNYQWRKGSIILTNILLNTTNCSFTLYNVQTNVTTTNGPGNYRVVVTNAANAGLASSFAALTVITATPPAVLTGVAGNISSTAATLNGSVNPNGSTTTARFDYGLSASYGNSTPAVAVGNGASSFVEQRVAGLTAGTTYHFRLIASNGGGTNYGADQSFTTTSPPPAPTLLAPAWLASQFSVSVATVNGATYHLERKTGLGDPDWTPVASVPGNGATQVLTDPAAGGPQGFYRVRVE